MRIFLLLTIFCSISHAEIYKASPHKFSTLTGPGVTDFTPHGTQPGLSFDIDPASGCGDCHGSGTFGSEPEDLDTMPYPTWAGSMMANATRDPLFWAAVDIANQDIPGVGDFCIRCHTPLGFYEGNTKDGTSNPDFPNGCELSGDVVARESKLNDYQGVTCHFCHRQEPLGPNGEAQIFENSNVWIDDVACDSPGSSNFGPCRKGPYNDYDTNPDVGTPPHPWKFSNYVNKAEMCGSCHNVSSPEVLTNGVLTIAKTLINNNGVDTGVAMPIERTFDEWRSSQFADLIYKDGFGGDISTEIPNLVKGQTCQDCHMPKSESLDARACVFNPLGARVDNLNTHEFAGGNSWMPQVLKSEYGADLDEETFSRSDAFDRTTSSALDMLQNKSAIISTEILSTTVNQVSANVRVTNLTGHKLPSGYHEGRRMWINVVATDNNGAVIFESGAYNSTTSELNETGAKIYESIQGIWDGNNTCVTEENGNKMFHFVLNNCIAKDTRIPPLGFTGASDIQLMPVGITYPPRPGHPTQTVNYDDTIYNIAVPNGTPLPITVTATLKYQTASKEYIEFLDAESTTASENDLCNRTQTVGPANQSRGAFMKSLWENNGKSAPVDMVSSSTQTVVE